MLRHLSIAIQLLIITALTTTYACAENKVYSFGVLTQRSITLSAQYWNPILKYVSDKSGVPLQLKMARTAPESSAMVGHSEYDFVYSNAIFSPENTSAGYKVFARPSGNSIRGQIVVLEDTSIMTLNDLNGKEVGFPSQTAFIGYMLTMNALKQAGVSVTPIFAGNQEGIMAQLKGKRVIAAGVNSQVMLEYAQRESLKYRVLWSSEGYLNLPLSAHPSIPKDIVKTVSTAFINMADDPEGIKILQASAVIIKMPPPFGFVSAIDNDYSNYRKFFKHNLLKDGAR